MLNYNLQFVCLLAGKRRYDRKQSGYGGQTKPIFHKKVFCYSEIIIICVLIAGMEIAIFSKMSDIFDIFDIYQIFLTFSFYSVGLGDVN